MALAPQPRPRAALDILSSTPPAFSAGPGAPGPFSLQKRGEPMIRGAVCPSAGTYGSVGALGRQCPGATRPDAGLILPVTDSGRFVIGHERSHSQAARYHRIDCIFHNLNCDRWKPPWPWTTISSCERAMQLLRIRVMAKWERCCHRCGQPTPTLLLSGAQSPGRELVAWTHVSTLCRLDVPSSSRLE